MKNEDFTTPNDIKFNYKNYKGETDERHVVPTHIWFGTTEFHTKPQWMLNAWDMDKGAWRDFAVADILGWSKP